MSVIDIPSTEKTSLKKGGDLKIKMDRIKTFLKVKKKLPLLRSVEKVSGLLEKLYEDFYDAKDQVSVLTAENIRLKESIKSLNEDMKEKINKIAKENESIEKMPNLSKEDVLKFVNNEFKEIIENNKKEHEKLNNLLKKQKTTITEYKKIIDNFEHKLNKSLTTKDVGIQMNMVDTNDIENFDEMENYFKNINSFLIGGKEQKESWAIIIISDIFSHKGYYDYLNYLKK